MSKIGINLSADSSVTDVLARLRVAGDDFKTFPPQQCQCSDEAEGYQAEMLYEKLGRQDIERILGYEFRQPSLLLQAFTHARSEFIFLVVKETLEITCLCQSVTN